MPRMSTNIGRPGSSYYQIDNGVKSDRAANLKTDELTAGQGDGRISESDAIELARKLTDAGVYTDAEKATAAMVREGKVFTPAGKEAFEHAIRSFAAKEGWETRREKSALTEQQATEQRSTAVASQLAARAK